MTAEQNLSLGFQPTHDEVYTHSTASTLFDFLDVHLPMQFLISPSVCAVHSRVLLSSENPD